MASKKKTEARAFAGFGESKIHAAPEGTFDREIDWDTLTFKGEPIPEHFRSVFSYAMTDQGMAETEKEIEARGGRAIVEFGRDAQDKLIDEYGDTLADPRTGLIQTSDPLAVVMARHLPKGMRGRWLGRRKTAEAGMIRGPVEYEPVMIDNPDKPGTKMNVTLGGMTLAAIPEELAQQVIKHYQDMEAESRASVNDKVQEHNAKNVGLDLLERAATRRDRLSDLIGETDDTQAAQLQSAEV